MAYTTIDKPSKYFNTVLWTGNGGTQTITGVGFQPSLVWGKSRSVNYEQSWIDFIRGGTKYLFSNGVSAESTDANAITSFNSDGFSIGSSPYIGNANGATYVGWNWLASNSTVSNTSGTLTSTVSNNPTAGFSILTYTGNGSSGATVGHGLGTTPACYIVKCRNTGGTNWSMYHQSLGNTKAMVFTATAARTSSAYWNNTSPTSTVFSLGNDVDPNGSGYTYVAYCFAQIKGYSKFGSYIGNASSTSGPFIYTGFKPAFVIIKSSTVTGISRWMMKDNKRNTYNIVANNLQIDTNSIENTDANDYADFLSNGFRITATSTSANTNNSGETYIYLAFAENPFVTSGGIPVTAR